MKASKKKRSTRWDAKPDPRLTWSRCLRSGSWGGSAPPCRCGDQWAGSLFGCSGSAVPLPGSSGSFLFGDKNAMFSLKRQLKRKRVSVVRYLKFKNSPLLMARKARSNAREVRKILLHMLLSTLQFQKQRKKKKKGWRFSSESCRRVEARTTVEVSLCFPASSAFPFPAQRSAAVWMRCWTGQLL